MSFKIGKIFDALGHIFRINQTEHKGKMEFVPSISTSCRCNEFCQARMRNGENVCAECFADSLLAFRWSLEEALEQNSKLLSERLLTEQEIDSVVIRWTPKMLEGNPNLYTRIESFGDVRNVIQARNYIRIIKRNRNCNFAIWSKNWRLWFIAFQMEGKPDNCTFVLSSLKLNVQDLIPSEMEQYVDHVFTVYDADYIAANGIETNCAAESCAKCGRCYRKNRADLYVNEKLRKKGGKARRIAKAA